MKILKLTIKKKWFDLIYSGKKPEEYREIKPFYISRLGDGINYKKFNAIQFFNGGYLSEKLPNFIVECKGITQGLGQKRWGAPHKKKNKSYVSYVFILKLGKILKKQ